MQLIGGGSEMIGELSQYRQIKLTPDTLNYVEITNPLTIRPKIIIFSCAADSDAATTQSRFFEGILKLFGTAGGQAIYLNANLVNTTAGFIITDGSTSNGRIGYSDGVIRINRSGASIGWSTTTEYTFDIYG